jgi:large conductance mechanosensitive channel
VDDLIMPPLGYIIGKIDFSSLFVSLDGRVYRSLKDAKDAGAPIIAYGAFLNNVINFLIVAFAVFLLVRQINRLKAGEDAKPQARECPFCAQSVSIKATRCPFCTSMLEEAGH